MINNISILVCTFTALLYVSAVYSEKYKLCIVDGRGGFKRSGRLCPLLNQADSKVECVLGIDRLDCLRRISKGKVDFSIFTPEDLVTAANSEIEVLLTNQLRRTPTQFEYEVVAIINNSSRITSRHDLKDKKFCHPGYGYETDWTRILSNYLEASVIPASCQPKLTITENRIKASSEFFRSACKAGPWVNDPELDLELKLKYPNLCALCDSPSKCAASDKYWGRRGPLFCLTDGAGDIAWARLDDVNIHFGFTPGGKESTPDNYSFLCPDGTVRALNGTKPCVWVVKPWSVIATQRKNAQDIQEFIGTLKRGAIYPWQTAALNLIQSYSLSMDKIEPVEAIESYLDKATGFLSANSFSGCHPPRTIQICVTSILEFAKCGWLRESAAAYGIEPDLQCLKADNTTHCMQAVNLSIADLVMVSPDLLHEASRYNLKTLFYETVNDVEKYLTVGVTTKKTGFKKLQDLKGAKVCFPSYDGVAWNSIISSLKNKNLLNSCNYNTEMTEYFDTICAPNLPSNINKKCKIDSGDISAIQCLLDGKGDVAFVSKNAFVEFIEQSKNISLDDYKIICREDSPKNCHFSWAPAGQAMIRSNSTDLWMKDALDVFLQLDNLLGKNYKSLTNPLQMYGLFDGHSNVIFHDNTARLRNVPTVKNTDNMEQQYEDILKNMENTKTCSKAVNISSSFSLVLFLAVIIRSIIF